MFACACMISYLGDYLQEGNTLCHLLHSEQDGLLYTYRGALHRILKLISLLYMRCRFAKCISACNYTIHRLVFTLNCGQHYSARLVFFLLSVTCREPQRHYITRHYTFTKFWLLFSPDAQSLKSFLWFLWTNGEITSLNSKLKFLPIT